MDRLEGTIACTDEQGRHYTVHVLRKQESWTGRWASISSGPQMLNGLRTFVLSDDPCRAITLVQGVDAFEILDAGTIIRSIGQPQRQ